VVLIDDLIATGGTMMAGKKLLEQAGCNRDRRRGHRGPARARGLGSACGNQGLPLFTLVDFEGWQ
jgi:orotate phosphoribosyltransferase